jgi:hypothetical protein
MSTQTVIDNEYVTLVYHTDTGIVHHQFHRSVRGAHFREALMKGCELLERNRATKWLSDDRGNSAVTPQDSQWRSTVWFPAVVAVGWKHWAVVMPEKRVGQLNMRQWVESHSGLGVASQVFDDPVRALEWLEAQ